MRPDVIARSRPGFSRHGFTLAVFVLVTALIVAGQVIFLIHAGSGALGTSVSPALHGTPAQRLHQVVHGALGGSDRGVRRFSMTTARTTRGQYSVAVTWAINNDLSAGTTGNGAELDAYNLFRGLYESHLPVALVRLTGTYPISSGQGTTRETPVLRLSMNRSEAAFVARTGWEVLDAQTVWPLIERHYVNPQFRPISSD